MLKIFLSLCLLGFFLIPAEASACSSSTTEVVKKEKSCSNDSSDGHHTEGSCEKDCCKEDASTDCSGNCGQKSCHSSFPTFWMHDNNDAHNAYLFESERSFPLHNQPNYSSGFHSIWQPPKIA